MAFRAPSGKPDTRSGGMTERRILRPMAIRVGAGTADLICVYADGFVVEVTEASDVDAATRALGRARADIEALGKRSPTDVDGPVISPPVLGPEGPLIRLQIGLEDPEDLIEDLKRGLDAAASLSVTGPTAAAP